MDAKINRKALDMAIKRFPFRLHKWRKHGLEAGEIHALVPQLIAEYRRVVAELKKQAG